MEITAPVDSAASTSAARRVYYYRWRVLGVILLAGFSLFVVALFADVLLSPSKALDTWTMVWIVVLPILWLDFCLLLGIAFWHMRLVTTSEGMEYYNIGYSIKTTWDNVIGQGENSTGQGRTVQGLLLRQPAIELSPWFHATVDILPFLSVVTLLRGRLILPIDMSQYASIIPVGDFVADWQNSPLGDDIRRFAPQVSIGPQIGAPAHSDAATLDSDPTTTAARRSQAPAPAFPEIVKRRIPASQLLIVAMVALLEAAFIFGVVRLWSGQPPLLTLQGGYDFSSIAISPDSRLVGAATSSEIRLWQTGDGTLVRQVQVPGVQAIAFSPDGQLLLSGDWGPSVKLWRVSDGSVVRAWQPAKEEWVESVAFSPDGKLVAAGTITGMVHIWRVSDGAAFQTIQEKPAIIAGTSDDLFTRVTQITWLPDGRTFVDLEGDGTTRIRRTDDGALVKTLPTDIQFIESFALAPNSRALALGDDNGNVVLWAMDDNSRRTLYSGRGQQISGLSFSPDGQTLAFGSADGQVRIMRISDGLVIGTFRHEARVQGVVFSPNGKLIASGSPDQTLRLWPVPGIK